jgi:hypothetical protein
MLQLCMCAAVCCHTCKLCELATLLFSCTHVGALQCPFPDALRLTLLYKTWIGQLLLSLPLTWWILSWQHHRVARYADSPKSKKSIKPFIKARTIESNLLVNLAPGTQLVTDSCYVEASLMNRALGLLNNHGKTAAHVLQQDCMHVALASSLKFTEYALAAAAAAAAGMHAVCLYPVVGHIVHSSVAAVAALSNVAAKQLLVYLHGIDLLHGRTMGGAIAWHSKLLCMYVYFLLTCVLLPAHAAMTPLRCTLLTASAWCMTAWMPRTASGSRASTSASPSSWGQATTAQTTGSTQASPSTGAAPRGSHAAATCFVCVSCCQQWCDTAVRRPAAPSVPLTAPG